MDALRRVMAALASGTFCQTLVRRSLRAFSSLLPIPFEFLVETGSLERPAHAYCMWHAAKLAQRLGYKAISVVEFGVASGGTLLIIERYATDIEKALGVRLQVYGFDTGAGLPHIDGVKDLPYWFQPTQYAMDQQQLRSRLVSAKLVLGNVRDTVRRFFDDPNVAPLGAIFNDLDLYSSTSDALRIFETGTQNFLPRIFMYLDDVCGSPWEMYGPFNGEIAADDDFNAAHDDIKIHLNQNLLPLSHLRWRYQIYYVHLFKHARYGDYVGGDDQQIIERALRLHA